MTPQIVLSFLSFVALSGITPGPANLTSLATSLTYGKNSALRQWVGLISGCITDAMISVLIAYFLGTALNEYVKYLAFVGVAYLMWMAFHMLKTNYSTEQKDVKRPGFWRGYFLQLTNVKVILTCITALSSYVLPVTRSFNTLLIFGFCLGVIQPTCNLVWLFTGVALQRFFVRYQKIINVVMAVLLMLCAVSLAVVPFKKTTEKLTQTGYEHYSISGRQI